MNNEGALRLFSSYFHPFSFSICVLKLFLFQLNPFMIQLDEIEFEIMIEISN
jgi:hypothetical protein